MPIFKFYSIPTAQILPIANELQHELAQILETDLDNITLQVIHADTLMVGAVTTQVYPQVEVQLFPRPQAQYKSVALAINRALAAINYPDSDVFFIHLSPENYFENGVSFAE